jgi:Ca2+-binding RTX toxin-like protein
MCNSLAVSSAASRTSWVRPAVLAAGCAVVVATFFAGSVLAARIIGTAKGEVLKGTSAADVLSGMGGNDRLYGYAGNDRLIGGPGNDFISGGPGADRISCGPGRDTVASDARDTVSLDCERGPVRPAPIPAPRPPAPPPAPPPPAYTAQPGHYVGQTVQGQMVTFDVAADGITVTRIEFSRINSEGGCSDAGLGDYSGLYWTGLFWTDMRLNADGTFARETSWAGSVDRIPSQSTFRLSGRISGTTGAGTASMSTRFEYQGVQQNCRATVAWSAQRTG